MHFLLGAYDVYAQGPQSLADLKQALKIVEPLNLIAAPEFVAEFALGADGLVLVLRYRTVDAEKVVRCEDYKGTYSYAAQRQFRHDFQKLADHGYYHPYLKGQAHWLMGSVSGRLFAEKWLVLTKGTSAECAEMIMRLNWRLAERSAHTRIDDTLALTPGMRVLLPVIHPVNEATALASVEVAIAANCRGVFLINQGMTSAEVLQLVMTVRRLHPQLWVGVNLLGHRPEEVLAMGLAACEGRLDGIWSDNAHIDETSSEQPIAQAFVDARRAVQWQGLYLGGVAFKYQREVPPAQLGAAGAAAAPYMDVVCSSGPGTGHAADLEKVASLRDGMVETSALALASGVTEANVRTFLPDVQAFLVGTSIESSFGVLDPMKTKRLADIIHFWPNEPS
jgi:predicted TIM-barrel enzyme